MPLTFGREADLIACARCHASVPWTDVTTTLRGSNICQPCLMRAYWQCNICDGWNADSREECYGGCETASDWYEDDQSGYDGCTCSACRPAGGLINSYYYTPTLEFRGDGPLYLGAEIEIETGRVLTEAAHLVSQRAGDLIYLKSDGSISEGFEMVTHPMSYQWAIDNFPWPMLRELSDLGCYTQGADVGIHIHVSRKGFDSPAHVYRWMKFIYRNEHQVSAIARRRRSGWAQFSDESRSQHIMTCKGARGTERYVAINTLPDHTYEMRIFASSLVPEEVQAAFGLAAGSVEYTRKLTSQKVARDHGWSWSSFAEWIGSQPIYAPLRRQMEVLGCVS